MVIRTIGESYHVIRTLEGSPGLETYLCVTKRQEDAKMFLVMGAKEPALSRKMLLYFMELQKARCVNQMEDCFSRGGSVWVVFRFAEGRSLMEQKIEGSLLRDRLDMGRQLVEQIFAQNLPTYLQYEATAPSNIVVDTACGVRVNFQMLEPEKLGEELFPAIQKRFADCFGKLFAEELKEGVSEELGRFFAQLEQAEFVNESGLYRAYRRLEETLKIADEAGKLKKKGLLTRLWKAVAKHGKTAAVLMYWIVVGCLLGLLVYVCTMPETAPPDRNRFTSIGTLEIEEEGR